MKYEIKGLLTALVAIIGVPSTLTQTIHYVRPAENSSCPGEPCMMLDEYVSEAERYFVSNSMFSFLLGEHTLSTSLTMVSVTRVSFQGQCYSNGSIGTRLMCRPTASIILEHSTDVNISTMVFESCSYTLSSSNQIKLLEIGFSNARNTTITALSSHMTISNSLFVNNSGIQGGSMHLRATTILFIGDTTFISNTATEGGSIYAVGSSLEFQGITMFERNTAENGGAISSRASSVVFHGTSTFTMNRALSSKASSLSCGGAVYLSSSSLVLNGSSAFESNTATNDNDGGTLAMGGAIAALNGSHVNANNKTGFIQNEAHLGGALLIEESMMDVSGSTLFLGNTATTKSGGAMHLGANSSTVCVGNTKFLGNAASWGGGGAMMVQDALYVMVDGALFLNNVASGTSGGAISVSSSREVTLTACDFTFNSASLKGGGVHAEASRLKVLDSFFDSNVAHTGGAVGMVGSSINFTGYNNMEDNRARAFGSGGIHATNSTILINGHSTFYNNTGFSGGCIYADRSSIGILSVSVFKSNTALYQGGAVYLSDRSVLSIGINVTFSSNSAREGGAVALANGARLTLSSPLLLNINSNEAHTYGGGIYYTDLITISDCVETNPNAVTPKCFLEVGDGSLDGITLNFIQNTAQFAGSVLYGGGLDRCQTLVHNKANDDDDDVGNLGHINNSLDMFQNISTVVTNDTITSVVSSDPLEICFCEDGLPDCLKSVHDVTAFPGQLSSVLVIVLGQGGGPVPSGVLADTNNINIQLSSREQIQHTDKVCTNLDYRVRSPRHSELLTLHPEGSCGNAGAAHRDVHVTLLACPSGFTFSSKSHACMCDERLLSRNSASCNVDTMEIESNGRLWIDASNGTDLLLSRGCPLSYCSTPPISVTLDYPDAQCVSNHSGTLCGGCSSGYSLTFGSSRCLECSNECLGLILAFALCGAVLVAFLFVSQFTTDRGMIHGLIFYANLVQMNKDVLLPRYQTNVLTVFIAWLNLDLGIETCFYDSMDPYAHTWLQFTFPFYLWVLIGLIFILCRYSKRIAKLLGSTPIAVLGTLLLLSYTKILRTIITALSVSTIESTAASYLVWRRDGNMRYFQDTHHIVLGLMSLSVLFLGLIPFALLFLCWSIIEKHSGKKGLSWVYDRAKPLMDVYHRPFRSTQLSWIGLLLLARIIVEIGIAIEANEHSILLLTLILTSLLFLIPPLLSNHLYKKKLNDLLEYSFMVNFLIFSGSTLYVLSNKESQTIIIISSLFLGIAFVEFIGILLYQLYIRLFRSTGAEAKLMKAFKRRSEQVNEEVVQELNANDESLKKEHFITALQKPLLTSC